MNNPVVIRADNHDILCIVIEAVYKVIDVMGVNDVRTVVFADKRSADLATIAVYDFQIITDCF